MTWRPDLSRSSYRQRRFVLRKYQYGKIGRRILNPQSVWSLHDLRCWPARPNKTSVTQMPKGLRILLVPSCAYKVNSKCDHNKVGTLQASTTKTSPGVANLMSRFRNKIAHVGILIDTRAVTNSEALTIVSR